MQGNISHLNVNNSPYFPVERPQGAALLKLEWPLYEGGLLQNKLALAHSKREEAAAALKERTDQALRKRGPRPATRSMSGCSNTMPPSRYRPHRRSPFAAPAISTHAASGH